jgi:hypothetical protein
MAFMELYDRRNLRYPEQETEETLQPGYTSPQIRAWGAQRFRSIPSIDPRRPQIVGPITPSIPKPNLPLGEMGRIRPSPPTQPEQPAAPKITPFLWNMMSSMRDMDVESRGEYLETVAAGIKDKLDSFALRLARGVPLTPEQNKRYMSLRDAFNDIQRYSTNQEDYDKYLSSYGKEGGASAPAEYEAWRVGQYRR